jgi:hypothetical protein
VGLLARALWPDTSSWAKLRLHPADMVAYGVMASDAPPSPATPRARQTVHRLGLGGMILRVRWSYPDARASAGMPLMWYFLPPEAAAPLTVTESIPVPRVPGQQDRMVRAWGDLLRMDSAHVTVASAHSVVRWLHVLTGARAVREGLLDPEPWIRTAAERLPRILGRIDGALREGAATPLETAELQRETRAELDYLATAVRTAIQEAGRIETVLAQADQRMRAVEDEATAPAREIATARQQLAMDEALDRARSNRHGLTEVARGPAPAPRLEGGAWPSRPRPRHGTS